MRMAICDDEEKVRKALINKVSRLFPDDEVKDFVRGDNLLASVLSENAGTFLFILIS